MTDRVPALIEPLLDEYLLLVETKLPGFLSGFYLQGSIAFEAFNERLSDIDFVALLSRGWNESDLAQLKEIHQSVQTKYSRWPLQGIYIKWEDLAHGEGSTWPHLNYHDGLLQPGTKLEINGVDWWLLKKRGVTVKGLPAAELDFKVDWELLINNMRHNLNTYWLTFTYKPNRMAWLFSNYGVQWAVLGVLRQYYTFKENDITSKTGAGEYALRHLLPKWQRLIQEAINIREGNKKSFYKSRVLRAIEAIRFLKYIIRACNSSF
jgi:hypothetical protein